MIGGEELGKDTIEQLELAGCAYKFIIDEPTRADFIFHTFEQVRMLADLSKLHELVTQSLDTARFPVQKVRLRVINTSISDSPLVVLPVRNHLVLLHLLVELALQRAHPHFDDLLNLIWQFALHILLQPP